MGNDGRWDETARALLPPGEATEMIRLAHNVGDDLQRMMARHKPRFGGEFDVLPDDGASRTGRDLEIQQDFRATIARAALGVVAAVGLQIGAERQSLAEAGGLDLGERHSAGDEVLFDGLGTPF